MRVQSPCLRLRWLVERTESLLSRLVVRRVVAKMLCSAAGFMLAILCHDAPAKLKHHDCEHKINKPAGHKKSIAWPHALDCAHVTLHSRRVAQSRAQRVFSNQYRPHSPQGRSQGVRSPCRRRVPLPRIARTALHFSIDAVAYRSGLLLRPVRRLINSSTNEQFSLTIAISIITLVLSRACNLGMSAAMWLFVRFSHSGSIIMAVGHTLVRQRSSGSVAGSNAGVTGCRVW